MRTAIKQHSSPDLNPLDDAIWDVFKNKTNATSHPNIGSLKTAIVEELNKMSEKYNLQASKLFRSHVNNWKKIWSYFVNLLFCVCLIILLYFSKLKLILYIIFILYAYYINIILILCFIIDSFIIILEYSWFCFSHHVMYTHDIQISDKNKKWDLFI